MDKTKFLHIGDIHFDSKFIELDEKQRFLRQHETFETLKRVLFENNDVQIVLFAGDLFDGMYNKSTIINLCKLFDEHPDKHFFISCGNHDYLSCECIKKLSETASQNVHIFSDTITFCEIEDYQVRIYGASFSEPHLYSSLLAGFNVKKDNLVNIMLMHGDISSNDAYNPIELSDIRNSGLDYLALGHKHNFSGIKTIGETIYVYPGILEPRGFDECGVCGVVKGEIFNGKITTEFLPANLRCYEIINIDITDVFTESELISKINSSIDKNNLYRIFLTGTKNENLSFDTSLLESAVNAFYCEIFNKTTSTVDIFSYLGENSLRGKVAETLDSYIAENKFDDEKSQKEVIEILTEILFKGGND